MTRQSKEYSPASLGVTRSLGLSSINKLGETSDCIPTLPMQISVKKLEFSREKVGHIYNDKENVGI